MRKKFNAAAAGDKFFYAVVFVLLTLFFLIVLYPCVFVVSASFSAGESVMAGKVKLFPVDLSVEGYKMVFNTSAIWQGFRNSVIYTISFTLLHLTMTFTAAYCLSRTDMPGRNIIIMLYTFTMFFSGGLIPSYMLIRALGMLNTPFALIIPGMVGVYPMIMAKTFIQNSIPKEIFEAARIDGCSDTYYYIRIVLPLSKAIIAVIALFAAVAQWNSYFSPMIYLGTRSLYPLTIILKEILLASQFDPTLIKDPELQMQLAKAAAVIKYALIVVTLVPVILIYPFVQKYFVKGVMIGSVKG